MTVKTEGRHPGEFILSVANGNRSFDNITLVSGQNLVAGAVLGKITASGKFKAYDDGASDGSQAAAGILLADTDASAADVKCVGLMRDAEVINEALKYLTGTHEANGITDLAALGIMVRS